ncbi:MAG: tetracycline resistance protein, partial [Acidobacteria bacterium]|nr:tetracycline resistance protein [Acidobacteriota bacterium]
RSAPPPPSTTPPHPLTPPSPLRPPPPRAPAPPRVHLRALLIARGASRVLFLTVFIDLMGFGIVVPVLAFSAREYGAGGLTLGLILGSFSLMQFLFSPVWGRLSDRIGRRPVLMASLAGNVLGFLTFALASNVAMLFASRILCGIAAASIATAQAYVADSTDDAGRAKGMAIIGMAFGLGLVLGPPLGGILSSAGVSMLLPAPLIPGLAAATLSAIALLLAAFALPESRIPSVEAVGSRASLLDNESWRIFFGTRGLRLAGGSLAVLMCTLASLAPILVLVGRDRFALTARQVGYLFGLIGVVVVVLQATAVDRLARRLGDVGASLAGAASLLVGLLLIPFTRDLRLLVAATCLMGVAQGLCNSALSSYLSKIAPPAHRGGILGVSSSLNALARVLGPALAGFAYDALHAPGALLSQAIVVAVAIALGARLLLAPTEADASSSFPVLPEALSPRSEAGSDPTTSR